MAFLARSAGLGDRLVSSPHLQHQFSKHHHLIVSWAQRPQPGLRTGNYAGRRNFSVAAAFDATIGLTQHAIVGLHTVTGLPWFVTIPISALVVNLCTRVPVTIFTKRIIQRRTNLAPLLRALYVRHSKEVAKEMLPPDKRRAKIKTKFDKSSEEIYAAFRIQKWKNLYGLSILPLWLTVMEGLRKLCGANIGLLSLLLYGSQQPKPPATEISDTGVVQPAGLADGTLSIDGPSAGLDVLFDGLSRITSLLGFEPSLTSGGCLWFTDLSAADPLHILPFVLSAAMFANVIPFSRAEWRRLLNVNDSSTTTTSVALDQGQWSDRLRRMLLALSLAVGPATMNLPAALHLYWISSSMFSLIQSLVVKTWYPTEIPRHQPCKGAESMLMRPLRQGAAPKKENDVK